MPAEKIKTRPIHEIRFGRIRAAIWENSGEHGTRYNTTVCRCYKSDEGWRETQSFSRDDLLIVAKVLDLCHSWIYENAAQAAEREPDAVQ